MNASLPYAELFQRLYQHTTIQGFDDPDQQYASIVHGITQLVKKGVPAHEIAIVLPASYTARSLYKQIEEQLGIIIYTESNKHLFNSWKILEYIIFEWNYRGSCDDLLFEILHFQYFNIDPLKIIQANRSAYSKKMAFSKFCRQLEQPVQFSLFESGSPDTIQVAYQNIQKWMSLASAEGIPKVYEEVVGFIQSVTTVNLKTDPHYIETLDFLRQLKQHDDQPLYWVNCLFLINVGKLQLPRPSLPSNQLRIIRTNEPPPAGVSKIFLVIDQPNGGFASRNFESYSPIFLSHWLDRENLAPIHLYITYNNEKARDVFLAALLDNMDRQQAQIPVSIPAVTPVHIDYIPLGMLRPLLKGFNLSASSLNSFLSCPLQFLYEHLLRSPKSKSAAMAFGSAIHHALEQFFLDKQKSRDRQQQDEVKSLPGYFLEIMQTFKKHFAPGEYEQRLQYGQEILEHYIKNGQVTRSNIYSIERNFKNVPVKHMLWQGKIDKLEFDGNDVAILDYKTGNPGKRSTQFARPSGAAPLGGNYWRQGIFYRILVNNFPGKAWKVNECTFHYIEPDADGKIIEVPVEGHEPDVTTVVEQAAIAWDQIHQLNLFSGCGKPRCYWCNFVKEHRLSTPGNQENVKK